MVFSRHVCKKNSLILMSVLLI